jgi:hypothetical protein
MQYPFKEGEHYFTIEDNTIVESVWDDQSEELYEPTKMYFVNFLEAFYFYRFIKTDEMLRRLVGLVGELETTNDEGNDKIIKFLEKYNYFNSLPKFSLL